MRDPAATSWRVPAWPPVVVASNDMPLLAGRVTDERLRAIGAEASALPVSYAAVGRTSNGMADPPTERRYRIDRYTTRLDGSFERAVDGLRRWEAHRGAGAVVTPWDAPVAVGTTVVVSLPVGPGLTMAAPCRIVYVTDEPGQCFGFGYGTLPGHPEEGEEAFHVARDGETGVVRFDVLAFSRPVHPLARLGAPVARIVQRAVTERYLRALDAYARH